MRKTFLLIPLIMSLLAVPLFADDSPTGEIEGQIAMKAGQPISNSTIAFFNADTGPAPDTNRYLRIPDSVTDVYEAGKFRATLPVGRYFIGGIKRISDSEIGPPEEGDYTFMSKDERGMPVVYLIEKDKNLKININAVLEPFRRGLSDDASGLSGTILDFRRRPMQGATVYAYTSETMTGNPLFTSYSTGKDGKFIITMDKGGEYYLKVRNPYKGGPPFSGEAVGAYGENSTMAVTVITGEITRGIVINLTEQINKRR